MKQYQLTEDDKKLINGMMGKTHDEYGPYGRLEYRAPSNIAAIYFDGQELVDLVYAHQQVNKNDHQTS